MNRADLTPALLACRSYRQFLSRAFAELKRENPRFSLAEFSRRAGFSSRSVPRDIQSGYRRMTPAALARFIQAFRLKGDQKAYFVHLVALDEPDCLPERISAGQIRERLKKLAQRLELRQ